ncbi:hypothetical protein B5M09_010469 [Aphanomyces astaci]|uniref:Uncharacterized protein n=1 Tax=Aphanomyces astaci TaxID=112090 RepID=A0A425CTZ3_APHAT|nr:hypothetical protein B5M09_010469 [Aphanomyces astaci]
MSRSNDVWHSATLVADPSARNLGKEWLTQQMYHNMHEPFALFPAARLDEDLFHIDVQMSDDGEPIMGVERVQFLLPGTVQMFRRLIECNMWQAKLYNSVVEEITANTRLFHKTTPKGMFVNRLQGHFVEANRFVMVTRGVDEDEAYVCDPQYNQQHYMSWTEVRQISPTHILLRFVSHVSQIFQPATGFVSVDEQATLKGVDVMDVDDGLKDEYVRRELIRRRHAELLPWRQHLMERMHQNATN